MRKLILLLFCLAASLTAAHPGKPLIFMHTIWRERRNFNLDHDTTVDGVHPSDWGYHLWAESVRKPILKILRKYGIR